MKVDIYFISIIFTLIFVYIIIELVRRNRLHEKYSLLWFVFAIVMIFLARLPKSIDRIAALLNVKYAPSLLFLVGLVFVIAYILNLTIVISRQGDRLIKLTQEISILKENTRKQEQGDV